MQENISDDPELIVAVEVEMSEEELEQLALEAAKKRQARENLEYDLANSIQKKLLERASNRQHKELQWITAERLRLGSLSYGQNAFDSPDDPFSNKGVQGGRSPEVNIIYNKCEVAQAQLISKQFSGGDKNWDLQPLPMAIQQGLTQQEANARADAMEATIYKQLTSAKYGQQMRKALSDLVNKGTGIIKGPNNLTHAKKTYEVLPDGTAIPAFNIERQPSVIRVDPWFCYPDDTVQSYEECEDHIEVHPMSKTDLLKLAYRDDFRGDAILKALTEEPAGFPGQTLHQMYENFSSNMKLWEGKYCVCEYYGPLSKGQMDQLELSVSYENPADTYYAEIWTVGTNIIRIELSNIEGADGIPYAAAVWKEDPGNIFGIPSPLLMRDAQNVVNTAWRAVLDNTSISAGPQAVIDATIVEPQNGRWELEPFKIWRLKQFGSNVNQAVQYISPPNNAAALMSVMQASMGHAEEESGIPLLTQGIQSPRATDAGATGMAVMEEYSTTILDMKAEEVDDCLTHKAITWMYEWNMQYNPDPAIKVPVEIDVRTTTDLKGNQVAAKNLEKVLVQAAQDPEAGLIINREEAFRALLSMINVPFRGLVRTKEEVEQIRQQMSQNQQPDPKMLELQLQAEKLAFEKEKLAFEMQHKMQLEQMDSQERLMNAETRRMEAQAQVLAKQLEYQAKMAELAARSENDRAKIIADLEKADTDRQVDLFIEGQRAQQTNKKLALQEAEARKAIQTGEGW